MIIYKGRGILVLFAALAGLLTGVLFTHRLSQGFMALCMFGVATVANYLLTRYFVHDETRELLDAKTGETVVLKNSATFFFILNRYWTYIFLVSGVILSLLAFKGVFE